MKPRRFLLVAGEASGDMYGAETAVALRERFPGCVISGLGGRRMGRAGVNLIDTIERTAVVGPFEAISHLRDLWSLFQRLSADLNRNRPDALILIDFPDFNLRLAGRARQAGIPVIYFVSPQIWAWRSGRIRQIREYVNRMLVIFPFEEELYRSASVDVRYVGHPLVRSVAPGRARDDFFRTTGLDPDRPLVALLPGSRKKEIRYILPTLIEAVTRLKSLRPALQFALPVASTVDTAFVAGLTGNAPVRILEGETYSAVKYAQVAVVASGTATLETALLGTPEVVVYRISRATWMLGHLMLRIRRFCIVNIILGEDVVRELFQDEMTPSGIAAEVIRLLDEPGERTRLREKYEQLRRHLGNHDVPRNVVENVAEVLNRDGPGAHRPGADQS